MNNESTYISAFNKLIGGKIIGLNTEFIKLFGGNEAILLAQCCYYDVSIANEKKQLLTNKSGEKALYWEHTDNQWYNEIYFGETALKNAKAKLVDAGVIEIIRAGQPAKSQYKINLQKIVELLAGNTSENTVTSSDETPSKFGRNTGTSSDETPELDQVNDRNIRDYKTEINKTENIKEDKDIEFFVKNSEFSENFQTSEQEQKVPEQENVSGTENVSKPNSFLNAGNASNIINFETAENGINNETNKNKKNGKSGSNSDLNKKEKESTTPEQKAIRTEIKTFLAHKCFHAANESEMAMLAAKNIIRLNNAAKTLEKAGALPNQMPELWKHFLNVDTWKGKEARNNPLTNTDPEPVVACWLSFKTNGFKAAELAKTTYQPRTEQPKQAEHSNTVFVDTFEDAEETFRDVATITDDEDYATLRTNWLKNYGAIGEKEVIAYENSNDYAVRFRRMAA